MLLSSVVDFYITEAVLSYKPDFNNKAQEKLYYDASEYFQQLSGDLALALRDYIFVICMGEARHAYRMAEWHWANISSSKINSRGKSYRHATDFDPTTSLPKLVELFDGKTNRWDGGGFGGNSWAKIAEAGMQYRSPGWSDAIFIDHVVDIAHNGGLAFDKFEASSIVNLELDFYTEMLEFLKEKAESEDILKYPPSAILSRTSGDMSWSGEVGWISTKAKSFIRRFYITRKLVLPSWVDKICTIADYGRKVEHSPRIIEGYRKYVPVKWGTKFPDRKEESHGKEESQEEEEKHFRKPASEIYPEYKAFAVGGHFLGRVSFGKPAYLVSIW